MKSLLACMDWAPAIPAPLLHRPINLALPKPNISRLGNTYSAIVCNIIVASEIPNPAPPNSSGRAIPIQPSFANAACRSWGYSPDSSWAAQYSYERNYSAIVHHVPVTQLTSEKFEQILAIASLTSNCVSENPLVSINEFARRGADIENGLEQEIEQWWRLTAFKHLGIYFLDNDMVQN